MSKRHLGVITVLVLILVIAGAGVGWMLARRSASDARDATGGAEAVKYHCPMHPTMVSDRPGDCPICAMRLVPMESEEHGQAAPAPASRVPTRKIIYRSTMNPDETADRPGKDSMGMEMVPLEIDQEPATSSVPDRAVVRIPLAKQQLIGVTTTPVERVPFTRTVRAVARVTYDETRLRHVHTKIAGFVERLHVNATGQLVRQGEPLLEIYSPELLASQQEFLVALEARDRTAGSDLPSVSRAGEALVASARRRLELFDLTEEQIRELETSGLARRTVTLYAPISGYVLQRDVTQGERIEPGTTLLDVADLSKVWAIASVYEYELPFVQVGQRATLSLSYVPGKTIEGRVAFIYPTLEVATRTLQVRVELPNPGLALKPEMYAEAMLEADLGPRLAVPESAVIETGTRSIVFVDRGQGLFEPREVEIGLRLEQAYEVLSGLSAGERVLTSGNFFVDSESRLKAALASMAQGSEPAPHQH